MASVFSKTCIKKLVETYREQDGRKNQTSFCIVDAQSVKNTWIASEKGYDAGKKVSGIKRHIAVDTNGLIHAIEVTPANITDREGAIQMCERHKKALDKVTNILCDGGYTGPSFAQSIKETINCSVEIIKRSELHKFGFWCKNSRFIKNEPKIPNGIELYAVKPKISLIRYICFWTDFSPLVV
jgi:transposase